MTATTQSPVQTPTASVALKGKKLHYTVTLPSGEVSTRTSSRVYSHVVLTHANLESERNQYRNTTDWLEEAVEKGYRTQEEADANRARAAERLAWAESDGWVVQAYCGRADLALKTADQRRNDRYQYEGVRYYDQVQVVAIIGQI